jgi:outer membrane protein assembly factor BamA
MNNEYERLGYAFDKSGFAINSSVGFDGGIYIGARYRILKHGFRKEPYASRQDFIVAHELALNSFRFRYNGEFIDAIGKTDLLVKGDYFKPTARTNFFGLGNESVYDKSNNIQYYRARYELANLSVLARTNINSWMDFRYGPTFQYFQLKEKDNEGKFITTANHAPADEDIIHQSYFYTGGELQFNINTKNNPILPTRGTVFNTTLRSLVALNSSYKNLTQLNSTLVWYSDFLAKDHLVLATRFGFNHNIGDYQYAQANYLGFRENLRGFRIHRFGGRTSAYNNIELRWKVTEIQTFLCPISFGLIAFNDVGRVWVDHENSSSWHNGSGGGIWISPINKIVITYILSYSKEEKNFPWITVGFQF